MLAKLPFKAIREHLDNIQLLADNVVIIYKTYKALALQVRI